MIDEELEDEFDSIPPEVCRAVPSYRFGEFISTMFLTPLEEEYLESIRVKPEEHLDAILDKQTYYHRLAQFSIFIQQKWN